MVGRRGGGGYHAAQGVVEPDAVAGDQGIRVSALHLNFGVLRGDQVSLLEDDVVGGRQADHQLFLFGVARLLRQTHGLARGLHLDAALDGGPIVLQAAVPVLDDDTAETLAARILDEEHRIYSEAIDLVLSGRCSIEGRRVLKNPS